MRDPATMGLLIQLASFLGWMPWLIVLMIGGVVCLLRLSKQPREGWLVGIAIVLAIFARFGVPSLVTFIMTSGIQLDFGNSIWMWRMLYEFPAAVVQAVAWGLLLYAAFGEGKTAKSKYLVEDDLDERDDD
jgi:hypothetical protein